MKPCGRKLQGPFCGPSFATGGRSANTKQECHVWSNRFTSTVNEHQDQRAMQINNERICKYAFLRLCLFYYYITQTSVNESLRLIPLDINAMYRHQVKQHSPIYRVIHKSLRAVRAYGPGRPVRFAAHRQPLCWNSCTIHELFCL